MDYDKIEVKNVNDEIKNSKKSIELGNKLLSNEKAIRKKMKTI